ncbi:Beta-cyclopiazonate dehydrogenase [Lachnellula suecica]|uniref:Beta-cyclopiazonate dehydrogenase n=1 Tax=Lachnellula suecica TaxID=602035 RepID=A0A8T9C261_9HELO|nr:Beta-cyclopiazonate dehydrogenase [Lachnellula suecica]
MSFKHLLKVGLLLASSINTLAGSIYEMNGREYNIATVFNRDISIIGGGSAGTYSAVRLQDLGKSVLIIEKGGRLGGNTETYHDPVSKVSIDYGVRVWHKFPEVYNYFECLNVSLINTTFAQPGVSTQYFDFNTGIVNASYPPQNIIDGIPAASQAYGLQAVKYSYLDDGYNLPSPVPEDLLLPFADFGKKYSLEAFMYLLWRQTQGIGNFLQTPALYVLKYCGLSYLQGLQTGFVTTATGDNSLLYESAERVLDGSVVYNSSILDMKRYPGGVQIVLNTPAGQVLVQSKKLVIAIQPQLDGMQGIDLSAEEQRLFGQFKSNEYFAGILKNTGIPDNVTSVVIDSSQPYSIPETPNLYSIQQTGVPGFQSVTYISTTDTTNDEIQQTILDGIKRLRTRDTTLEPEFVAASIHKPFQLTVSHDTIENGFYDDLYALQGQLNTWYTSATFQTHDSSLIWRFTETLLPDIAA